MGFTSLLRILGAMTMFACLSSCNIGPRASWSPSTKLVTLGQWKIVVPYSMSIGSSRVHPATLVGESNDISLTFSALKSDTSFSQVDYGRGVVRSYCRENGLSVKKQTSSTSKDGKSTLYQAVLLKPDKSEVPLAIRIVTRGQKTAVVFVLIKTLKKQVAETAIGICGSLSAK